MAKIDKIKKIRYILIKILLIIGWTSCSYAGWKVITLDFAMNASNSSIAVDSNNNVHISYVTYAGTKDLKYATNVSGNWVSSIIDSSNSTFLRSSIAVDNNNKTHIIYWDYNSFKYATNVSGLWISTILDSSGNFINYASISIDKNNKVHISYYDDWNSDLKYATNTSGFWEYSTLDSIGHVGAFSSIAVDSNNKIHISYLNGTDDLKYATNVSGNWVYSTLAGQGGGHDTSIAIDNNNKVHIVSILGSHPYPIKYATNVSGVWIYSTLATIGNSGPHIVIDNNNKIHVVYTGRRYITNVTGSWISSSTSESGEDVSAAVDNNNRIHISSRVYNQYLEYTIIDNTKVAPVLSWTGEENYVSGGVDPEKGYTNTAFTFKVKYTDADGDVPLIGYPKLHIKKGGNEIVGSPFTMTYVSGLYITGAIYTYKTSITATGTDYSYYFEAIDDWNDVAIGESTSAKSGPIVFTPPVLAWTGESGYTSDGVNPEAGYKNTSFTYRIKYTNLSGDIPSTGYPKLHVLKSNVEVTGSPYAMTYVSGDYAIGAIYSYTSVLGVGGEDYSYYFEAKNAGGDPAIGSPTTAVKGPTVLAGIVYQLDNNRQLVYTDDGTNTNAELPKDIADLNVTMKITRDNSITDGIAYKFELKDIAGNKITSFNLPITISINYTVVNGQITNTSVSEEEAGNKLGLYWYDGVNWLPVTSSVNTSTKTVSGAVQHLSLFAVKEKAILGDKVLVAPNPFTPNGDGVNDTVSFYYDSAYVGTAVIKIYKRSGMLVWTKEGTGGVVSWDGKDDSGGNLETGLYIYHLSVGGFNRTGTVVLAR